MRVTKGLTITLVVSVLLIASGFSFAQSDKGIESRVFGLGQPASVDQLPVGKLRNRLESLPPQARSKALRWLQEFSFPEADLDTLEVDEEGGVFYGDTLLPDVDEMAAADSASAAAEAPPVATLDDVFLLHSRPGAPNVVFIDFDGDIISGTAWNGSISQIDAKPYDIDNNPSSFSATERARMAGIWHRVAEDLAPFNIDVTTEEPATFNSRTGHILVTHSVDKNNNVIYCTGCGGVAYVGVFGNSNYHTYYSPALVFFDKLGSGGESFVAEASSHEFGHNLGLSHDGSPTDGYYGGHGSGLVSWAPIMGNSYYNNVTQWSKGEYPGATQTQDDLSIINGRLGYLSDDHGDSRAAATLLSVDSAGAIVSSNPELDPHNVLTVNKGIIGSGSDVDVFSFSAGAGSATLTVTPGWDAFYAGTSRRGSNLDIEIELQDQGGAVLAYAEPDNNTSASITTTLNQGTYYLLITGVGNAVTPYSDYDSLGQYFINGSVQPASPDETAPTPDPMTWASIPAAVSYSEIAMTATTATDETSSVEYNFQCVVGGTGCSNSGWQSSSSYTAVGLVPSTAYTFQVLARDQADNRTGATSQVEATTAAPPPPPATPSNLSAIGASETTIDLSWTDNAGNEIGYRVERSASGQNSFSVIASLGANATSYVDSGLTASTTYDYQVAAIGDFVDSGYDSASGTTNEPPPYRNFYAISGTLVNGLVSGSIGDTASVDGSTQSITERESGGRKSSRYSYLEYRWGFNVSVGATVTVYANAWSGGSSDGDSFNFEYSLNNGNSWSLLFEVSSTNTTNLQSADIAGAPAGSIMIRVVDTDRSSGSNNPDTVDVDHLYIQVGRPSIDPPIGDPSGMTATAISSSRIDLAWTDGTSNESGFKVERSLDNSSWTEIADRAAGSETYSDTGLSAETTYFYQVKAYNSNGDSAYTAADARTPVAPALALTATGYKVKGKQHVGLDWVGTGNVDIYRGNTKIAADQPGSSYDDNIGAKGGATYTHKVCSAGTSTCSNITTTVF